MQWRAHQLTGKVRNSRMWKSLTAPTREQSHSAPACTVVELSLCSRTYICAVHFSSSATTRCGDGIAARASLRTSRASSVRTIWASCSGVGSFRPTKSITAFSSGRPRRTRSSPEICRKHPSSVCLLGAGIHQSSLEGSSHMEPFMFSMLVALNRRSLLLRLKFIELMNRFDLGKNSIWNFQAESSYQVDCRRYSQRRGYAQGPLDAPGYFHCEGECSVERHGFSP
jgi:hypothetical protein